MFTLSSPRDEESCFNVKQTEKTVSIVSIAPMTRERRRPLTVNGFGTVSSCEPTELTDSVVLCSHMQHIRTTSAAALAATSSNPTHKARYQRSGVEDALTRLLKSCARGTNTHVDDKPIYSAAVLKVSPLGELTTAVNTHRNGPGASSLWRRRRQLGPVMAETLFPVSCVSMETTTSIGIDLAVLESSKKQQRTPTTPRSS